MNKIAVFNFQSIGKGVLKATVSINLGTGIVLHECKLIDKEGILKVIPPQRAERGKGGVITYHDCVEFEDKGFWKLIETQVLGYYRSQMAEKE